MPDIESKKAVEMHPVQGRQSLVGVTSAVTLRAYEVYHEVHGEQIKMVTDGCRGGFGQIELIAFLYARSFPRNEWRARCDEVFKHSKTADAINLRERD